jgi:hypothetical protein
MDRGADRRAHRARGGASLPDRAGSGESGRVGAFGTGRHRRTGASAVAQDPDADDVDLVATSSELDFRSTSSAFRGGSVTTWFGGGVLDLRGATLDPAGATLRVNALFGGGNLVVPEGWNVETRITGLGGVGDGRPKIGRPADAPTLRFEGVATFGGWGIPRSRTTRRSSRARPPDGAGLRAKRFPGGAGTGSGRCPDSACPTAGGSSRPGPGSCASAPPGSRPGRGAHTRVADVRPR